MGKQERVQKSQPQTNESAPPVQTEPQKEPSPELKELVSLFERYGNELSVAKLDANLKPYAVRAGWAAKIATAKEAVVALRPILATRIIPKRLTGIILQDPDISLEDIARDMNGPKLTALQALEAVPDDVILCASPYLVAAANAGYGFADYRWGITEFIKVQQQYTEFFMDKPTSLSYKMAEPAPKSLADIKDLVKKAIEAECGSAFLIGVISSGSAYFGSILNQIVSLGVAREQYPVLLLGFDADEARTINPLFADTHVCTSLNSAIELIKSIQE